MTTEENTVHTCSYFSSIKRFCPLHAPVQVEDKKAAEEGRTPIHTLWRKIPKALEDQLVSTLYTLETLVRRGTDPSLPTYLHPKPRGLKQVKTLVLTYEDSDVEAIANDSEFIELIKFYDDPLHAQADRAITYLEKDGNDFYTISASTPEGSPLITNYVFPAKDLATFIMTTKQDVTQPIQEILAYRTKTLYNALLLAASKPF